MVPLINHHICDHCDLPGDGLRAVIWCRREPHLLESLVDQLLQRQDHGVFNTLGLFQISPHEERVD